MFYGPLHVLLVPRKSSQWLRFGVNEVLKRRCRLFRSRFRDHPRFIRDPFSGHSHSRCLCPCNREGRRSRPVWRAGRSLDVSISPYFACWKAAVLHGSPNICSFFPPLAPFLATGDDGDVSHGCDAMRMECRCFVQCHEAPWTRSTMFKK